MKDRFHLVSKLLLIFFLFSILFACKGPPTPYPPPPKGKTNLIIYRLFGKSLREPTIRVSLSQGAREVDISSEGMFYLVDKDEGDFLLGKALFREAEVKLLGEGGRRIYQIQVGSFSKKENGRRIVERLREDISLPVSLNYDEKKAVYQVRVGRFKDRKEATKLLSELSRLGFYGAFIVSNEYPSRASELLLTLFPQGEVKRVRKKLLFVPRDFSHPLKVNGHPYRGVVEVYISPSGGLLTVNELWLEDYLKGVVPCEMSPDVFPELEALKAQAVAARTYAVRNLGKFASLGFDICSTPSCQVYRGLSAERELTTKAVLATMGEVITYEGEPINALYTSTCGGHTENVENIFPGEKEPYLRGVECYPEMEGEELIEGGISLPSIHSEDGEEITEKVVLLFLTGVISGEKLSSAYLSQPIDGKEVEDFFSRALRIIGKKGGEVNIPDYPSLLDVLSFLVDGLGWRRRAQLMIEEKDVSYLIPDARKIPFSIESLKKVALLVKEGVINPFPDGSYHLSSPPSRGLVLKLIYDLLSRFGYPWLDKGTFFKKEGDKLVIKLKSEEVSYSLSSKLYLFSAVGGKAIRMNRLRVFVGDELLFHHNNGSIDFIKVVPSKEGIADDRRSPYHSWEVSYSREELTERVHRYIDLGEVVDLVPEKFGVSGRVIRLRVIGEKGEKVFSGLSIRSLLGLRDTLFVIERNYDAQGRIQRFTFVGKGWGHGVGLCQVGAFGMALRGASYRDILTHYYTGVSISRIY